MNISASGHNGSGRHPRLASWLHTLAVLVVMGSFTWWQKMRLDHAGPMGAPQRVHGYLIGIVVEWALFGLVLAGVWRDAASLRHVVGERWTSARQFLRDVGIALAFWVVAALLLMALSWMLRIRGQNQTVLSMLPHGPLEATLWVVLSVSAGICEEAIFRGYLQGQFMAATKSASAGVLLSAVVFGAAHAYQGLRMTVLIALFGLMFGCLAYWRGSVRPGMLAHAWQDSVNGVLAAVMRR